MKHRQSIIKVKVVKKVRKSENKQHTATIQDNQKEVKKLKTKIKTKKKKKKKTKKKTKNFLKQKILN